MGKDPGRKFLNMIMNMIIFKSYGSLYMLEMFTSMGIAEAREAGQLSAVQVVQMGNDGGGREVDTGGR